MGCNKRSVFLFCCFCPTSGLCRCQREFQIPRAPDHMLGTVVPIPAFTSSPTSLLSQPFQTCMRGLPCLPGDFKYESNEPFQTLLEHVWYHQPQFGLGWGPSCLCRGPQHNAGKDLTHLQPRGFKIEHVVQDAVGKIQWVPALLSHTSERPRFVSNKERDAYFVHHTEISLLQIRHGLGHGFD